MQLPNSASDELLYRDAVWARSHQEPRRRRRRRRRQQRRRQEVGHCLDWRDWCGPLGRWRHRRHHLGCLLHHRHRHCRHRPRRHPPPLPFPDSARPIRFWPSLFSPPSDSEHLLPISCNRHDRCLHWFFPPTSTNGPQQAPTNYFCFQSIFRSFQHFILYLASPFSLHLSLSQSFVFFSDLFNFLFFFGFSFKFSSARNLAVSYIYRFDKCGIYCDNDDCNDLIQFDSILSVWQVWKSVSEWFDPKSWMIQSSQICITIQLVESIYSQSPLVDWYSNPLLRSAVCIALHRYVSSMRAVNARATEDSSGFCGTR